MADTMNDSKGLLRVGVWMFHVLVLGLLIVADGPFARSYRDFRNWASDTEEERIRSIKGGPGLSVAIGTSSNGVPAESQDIALEPGEQLNIYRLQRLPTAWTQSLARKLLSREFWQTLQQMGTFYMGAIICFFIWAHDPTRRREVLGCLIGLVASAILVWFIQHMVGKLRIREAQWDPVYLAFPAGWTRASGFCFPSGHTTAAFVLATFLAGLYPRTRWAFYVMAAGCGLARIILQQHWISDVYAGALLGHLSMRGVRLAMRKRSGSGDGPG